MEIACSGEQTTSISTIRSQELKRDSIPEILVIFVQVSRFWRCLQVDGYSETLTVNCHGLSGRPDIVDLRVRWQGDRQRCPEQVNHSVVKSSVLDPTGQMVEFP